MPDEPEILRDLVTPVQPVRRPGNERSRGVREGLALGVVLVFAALLAGVLAVPRLPAGSPDASGFASGPTSPAGSEEPRPSIVAPTPDLKATPAVTPQVPCGTDIPANELIYAKVITSGQWVGTPLAQSWMAQPLPSSPDGDPPGPDIAIGDIVVLSTDYRACALAWSITLNGIPVSVQDNELHNPAYAAQNYFILTLPAVRDADPRLRAELLFSRGWAGFEWTLHLHPSPIPAAFFASAGQTVDAAPGCGFEVTLKSGSSAVDECASTIPPDGFGPYTLYTAPGSRVGFRAPNVVVEPIDFAAIACGSVRGVPPDLQADPACTLGPEYDPSNAVSFAVPARPGVWWIRVIACASRDSGRACGPWFVIVDTANPMPSDAPID